jgi:hypothetical protein
MVVMIRQAHIRMQLVSLLRSPRLLGSRQKPLPAEAALPGRLFALTFDDQGPARRRSTALQMAGSEAATYARPRVTGLQVPSLALL